MRAYRGRPVAPDGTVVRQAGQAAWRDASYYSKHGRARRYHIIAPDGGAACSGMPLVLEQACPPVSVTPALRCARPGCAKAWPHEVGIYRCPECGHGDNLTAWAGTLVHGPVMADGHLDLDFADFQEEDVLHVDSIECGKHPDAEIEKSENGQWCRWWRCGQCNGKRVDRWNRPCREPGLPPEPGTYGERHEGWRPAEVSAAAS